MIRRERGISEAYAEIFRSDARATVFHHPDFLGAAEDIFRGRLEIWWLEDRVACPFIVNRRGPYSSASSLGYGCYGGPLGDPARFGDFTGELARMRFSRLEIVDFSGSLPREGFKMLSRTAHIVELPDSPEGLLGMYSKLRRRELKKPVKIRRDGGLSGFFRLHRDTYRNAGVWFVPEKGIRALSGASLTSFYTAWAGQELVGGLLVLSWRDTAVWWINGWDKRFPGTMTHLLHGAMTDAIEEGRRFFNMGGTDTEGVARFKRSLGATEHIYCSLVKENRAISFLRGIKEGLG